MTSQDDEALGGDETQIRLLDWRQGQKSEYLAALILDEEGYKDIDPSHPLGGPDGGRDGHCTKDGEPWVWAVYFPRGQVDLKAIETKLSNDIAAARKHDPNGLVFVTNQELKLAERKKLRDLGEDLPIDLIHLYRVATILDRPRMSQIRHQYLRIGAGRPPVRVRAEVIGAARSFTNGGNELLEWFVEQYEKQIREESDKGWARVKAEEEKKVRAAAEKVRVEAEKARRQAPQTGDKNTPISLAELVQASMPSFSDLAPKFNVQDFLPKFEIPKYDHSPITSTLLTGTYEIAEPPAPPEPLTDEQISERVTAYRTELEARWGSCKEYLSATAWPGLKFRIHNAEGFLTNVQVVLTFHGARGLEHQYIESFVWGKLDDPSWTEPFDPRDVRIPLAAPPLAPSSFNDYPVKWEHEDTGDLVVKITLPQLRPHEVWTSDDDDVVLVLRDESLDSVHVTYTVTAQEHHDRVDGEPFTVSIEELEIFDSVTAAIEASRQPDD